MTTHRNHRAFDAHGKPVPTEDIDILSLPLIERDALPGLPEHMEGRLFQREGLEPAVVLFHPQAEVYVLVRLTDLDRLEHHVEQLNSAVLKFAMGETPPDDRGYPTSD